MSELYINELLDQKISEAISRRNLSVVLGKASFDLPFGVDPVDIEISNRIEFRARQSEKETSLYEFLEPLIKRSKSPSFVKANGEVNGAKFYTYARIDKSTWSNIRWDLITPNKNTLLKLIIALKLNEEEANELMRKGSNSLNPKDPRDLVILALIDLKVYDIETVYNVLEVYGKRGSVKFENIY